MEVIKTSQTKCLKQSYPFNLILLEIVKLLRVSTTQCPLEVSAMKQMELEYVKSRVFGLHMQIHWKLM